MTAELKKNLLEQVIVQIKKDIDAFDVTAIEELLSFVPDDTLIGYLPEKEWERFC